MKLYECKYDATLMLERPTREKCICPICKRRVYPDGFYIVDSVPPPAKLYPEPPNRR